MATDLDGVCFGARGALPHLVKTKGIAERDGTSDRLFEQMNARAAPAAKR